MACGAKFLENDDGKCWLGDIFCKSFSKTNRLDKKMTSHLFGLKKVDRSETLLDNIDL